MNQHLNSFIWVCHRTKKNASIFFTIFDDETNLFKKSSFSNHFHYFIQILYRNFDDEIFSNTLNTKMFILKKITYKF